MLLAQAPKQPKMPVELMGEPKTVGEMRIGDSFWVPAHCLEVDSQSGCWLDPKQSLHEKSDHLIEVTFQKERHVVGYRVKIDKNKLQGWRWKLGGDASQHKWKGRIPVYWLSISI